MMAVLNQLDLTSHGGRRSHLGRHSLKEFRVAIFKVRISYEHILCKQTQTRCSQQPFMMKGFLVQQMPSKPIGQ